MNRKFKIYLMVGSILSAILGVYLYFVMEASDDCGSLADNPTAWNNVLQKWKQQKLVLMVRHTTKCDGDLDDCPTDDEYLTEKGREEAAIIGEGLKKLPGPYIAYHSPMDRATETAKIALGEKSEVRDWLALACKTNFPDYFLALPEGSNYILVTHSNCFDVFKAEDGDYLLGFDSGRRFHFGISAFFEKDREGKLDLLGCVWPGDWKDLNSSIDAI